MQAQDRLLSGFELGQWVKDEAAMSYPQIAEALGISETQVRTAFNSGLQKLRLKAMARDIRREHCYD